MDKEMTGRLIAQVRREKGMTQQNLADRLHITAKAVSKWETGVSSPDVGLLVPLSEALGLTVTELLEGRRAVIPEDRTPEQVENIVKSAIAYSEQTPGEKGAKRKRNALLYAACVVAALLEMGVLWLAGLPLDVNAGWGRGYIAEYLGSFGTMEALALLFGAFAMFVLPDRLPRYYDDNKINGVNFGAFRMNMAGIYFNNRNWPYILRVLRAWCILTSVLTIPFAAVTYTLLPELYLNFGPYVFLALFLGGLFVPVYVVGRKYQ